MTLTFGMHHQPHVDEAMQQARSALRLIVEAMEWITDYPLHHVRSTAWDSFTAMNHVERGTLRGDHPIVPYSTLEIADNTIEAGSLYIGDRHRQMHLARGPYSLGIRCPQCGNFGVFMPDRLVGGQPSPRGSSMGLTSLAGQTDQLREMGPSYRISWRLTNYSGSCRKALQNSKVAMTSATDACYRSSFGCA